MLRDSCFFSSSPLTQSHSPLSLSLIERKSLLCFSPQRDPSPEVGEAPSPGRSGAGASQVRRYWAMRGWSGWVAALGAARAGGTGAWRHSGMVAQGCRGREQSLAMGRRRGAEHDDERPGRGDARPCLVQPSSSLEGSRRG
ncbi:hypothetical protein ACP70R_041856 [Stipagrostis hirtigluma subsp. patula]